MLGTEWTMGTATTATYEDLRTRLAGVDAEVRFDDGSLAAYSTDASNFRQVPMGVVIPKTVDDGAAALRICRDFDVPVLSRGGGTSLAGQCTNEAVVIDWTKYCHRLVSVDPQRRTCVVEPGIVLDSLNAQLGEDGLRVDRKSTRLNSSHVASSYAVFCLK